MNIRDSVRAYLEAHPDAKRRHIMAALNLNAKQADNALRVIRHGNQKQKPKPGAKPRAVVYPVHHLHSIWS